MDELRVRFCDGDQPDLALGAGATALGRSPSGLAPVDADAPWLLRMTNDRRGIWLTVADGMRGVHVNGRPVQQVAMLRAGDSIHVDGAELLLLGATAAGGDDALQRESATRMHIVLRGIGGSHHGRCLNLESPRRVGSAADADIRIEGEGIAAAHAVVELRDGRILLRDAASDVLVNGHRTRAATLRNGDQVAFGVQHRFVVEAPPPAPATGPHALGAFAAEVHSREDGAPAHWSRRVPWLLITALLLAGGLFALLAFGAR